MRLPDLRFLVDSKDPNSWGSKFRRKRLEIFVSRFPNFATHQGLKILDVGGTVDFWQTIPWAKNHFITLLNIYPMSGCPSYIQAIEGDACHMPQFPDKSFDLVFSNSVIEHVGDIDKQRQMAREVIRTARSYWVQTPSFWFPIEPHYIMPFLHWTPRWFRCLMLMNFNLGHFSRQATFKEAMKIVLGTHLLTHRQFRSLFPDSEILTEKCLGFTKSYIALKTP